MPGRGHGADRTRPAGCRHGVPQPGPAGPDGRLAGRDLRRSTPTYGVPFDHRAARFEEAIQIIAPLLRGEEVDFQGRYYEVSRCELRPRGPSPSGPPIWVGARGERMLRLVARYADADNVIWPHDADAARERWEHMVAICQEVGRDPATLDLTVGTHVCLPGEDDPDPGITGSYDEIAEQLLAFEWIGVSHLVIDFRPETTAGTLERFGRVLERMRQGRTDAQGAVSPL